MKPPSTPLGPAPTSTNVICRARSPSSSVVAASSNAPRILARIVSASPRIYAGALQNTEQRLAMLANRALSTVQRCAVACRRADLYSMLFAGEPAATVALECLRHVGIDWSKHPTEAEVRAEYERIWSLLGDRAIETLVVLPLMQDPEALATMDVLTRLFIPALYTDSNLVALAVCRAANLSLEHGNSDAATANYEALGIIASARFAHYDEAYRFGKMACDLVEDRGWKHFGGRTFALSSSLVLWTRPLGEGVDPTRRAFEMAKDGDPGIASSALRELSSLLLASGHQLDQVERETEERLEFVRRFGFSHDRIWATLALVRTLRGRTTKFGSLDDGQFIERTFEQRATGEPARAFLESLYCIRKLQARFFGGDYVSASEAADDVETWYARSASLFLFILQKAEYHFYAVTLLEVLASQAAISLENSRLYHDLADREGKIRRLVDANIIGIFIADREGRIFEANDAFLRIVGYDREDALPDCGQARENIYRLLFGT
jgi:PAS domain-containing protein